MCYSVSTKRAPGLGRPTSCAGKALHLHRPPASPGSAPAPAFARCTQQQAFRSLHALQALPPEARMPHQRWLCVRERPGRHVGALQASAQRGLLAEGCQRLVHANTAHSLQVSWPQAATCIGVKPELHWVTTLRSRAGLHTNQPDSALARAIHRTAPQGLAKPHSASPTWPASSISLPALCKSCPPVPVVWPYVSELSRLIMMQRVGSFY